MLDNLVVQIVLAVVGLLLGYGIVAIVCELIIKSTPQAPTRHLTYMEEMRALDERIAEMWAF